MNNEQVNATIAVVVIGGVTAITAATVVSFIEQIRKDRAARKAYEAITETSNEARKVFVNEQFNRIIRENDL